MTFQEIKGIAAGCDCPLMGLPVPPWDGVGRIGNLRPIGNPPLAPVDGVPTGSRAACQAPQAFGRAEMVYYLNVYSRKEPGDAQTRG